MQQIGYRHGPNYGKLLDAIAGTFSMVASAPKHGGTSPAKWHPGDRVRFRFGLGNVTGTIVTTVGPIGPNGRMLYRIEFRREGGDPLITELTADEFVRAN
jgi:hypothetical protein